MDAYTVNAAVLRKNVEICCREMGRERIYAVVKGDGYGLGVSQYGRFLIECGMERFAVTEPREAQALRQEGFDGEILMLRCTRQPQELEALLQADAVCTVGSEEAYAQLESAAQRLCCRAKAHLYIDSGMGREGFAPEETEKMAALCHREGAVSLVGVYTHFPTPISEKNTRQHFAAFSRAVELLRDTGWQAIAHCAASGAALRYADMRLDAVRLGSALLGRVVGGAALGLSPVGRIEAHIAYVQSVRPGQTLGYGSVWRARRQTQVAILDVGYHNGVDVSHAAEPICLNDYLHAVADPVLAFLRRRRKTALVNGKAVPLIGRVAMQNTLLDVTGLNCAVGDRVILPCSPLMVRHLPCRFVEE